MRSQGSVISGGPLSNEHLGLPSGVREDREAVRARMEAKAATRMRNSPWAGRPAPSAEANAKAVAATAPRKAKRRTAAPAKPKPARPARKAATKPASTSAPAWRRYDDAFVAQVRDLYGQGLPQREVAERLGVGIFVVQRLMGQHGIVARSASDRQRAVRQHDDAVVAQVRDLYAQGLSQRQVGERLGLRESVVYRLMSTHGIETRKQTATGACRDPHVVEEVRRLYVDERLTVAQVQARVGLSRSTVARIMHAAGIAGRRGRAPTTPRPAPAAPRRTPDRDALVADYLAGKTIPVIAAEHGHAKMTVRNQLLRAGVTLRDDRKGHSGGQNRLPERDDPAFAAQVRDLYAQGLTLRAIAARLDVSDQTVKRVAADHGIELRTPAVHDPEVVAELRRLYVDERRTQADVAAALGISKSQVVRIMAAHHILARRPGPRQADS